MLDEAVSWLKEFKSNEYSAVEKVYSWHKKETWDYFINNEIYDLPEQAELKRVTEAAKIKWATRPKVLKYYGSGNKASAKPTPGSDAVQA
jgi:hypothetical protein